MQPTAQASDRVANPVAGLLSVKVPALGKKRGLPNWKVRGQLFLGKSKQKVVVSGMEALLGDGEARKMSLERGARFAAEFLSPQVDAHRRTRH
jgi:hypothetical protein